MSNHSVGHAINEVTRGIFSRYLLSKLDKEIAKNLISLCYDCSGYEDGNEYEGVECLEDCVCGSCLRILPEGTPIYRAYYCSSMRSATCSTGICADCLAELKANGKISAEEYDEAVTDYCGRVSFGYFVDPYDNKIYAEGSGKTNTFSRSDK